MDLTSLTIDQLKVMGYDLIASIQAAQNNLSLVNAQLNKLSTQKPPAE